MSKSYFISDAHLGLGTKDEERAKEQRLIEFLDAIKADARYLFIVGDLFDAWFEYRTVIPKGYHRLFTTLHDLSNAGIEIHYLAGNHDFWRRDFFTEELGVIQHVEPFTINIENKSIYIHHGDGLANHDSGYRLLKKVLRNKLSVWLYTWIHPDIGIPIARSTSEKSRNYTTNKDYGESDGMLAFAKRKIDEGADVVVMGHRHQPIRQVIGNGVYVNLGDWITHNSFAEITRGDIALKIWQG
jgi:UDP-2,3-diacylglucosamine hydrolase